MKYFYKKFSQSNSITMYFLSLFFIYFFFAHKNLHKSNPRILMLFFYPEPSDICEFLLLVNDSNFCFSTVVSGKFEALNIRVAVDL